MHDSLTTDPARTDKPPLTLPGSDRAVVDRVDQTLDHADQLLTDAQHDTARCALSIVLPVYNECGTIAEIVRRVQALDVDKEILIVDDGSSDGTGDIVEQLAQADGVTAFRHPQNLGKGAALRTGFAHARGEIVAVQDADLEYDPNDILMLMKPIQAGRCDVVYGSRYLSPVAQDPSWLHRGGNRFLTLLSNLFTGQNLSDMETCYKVMRRTALAGIEIRESRFGVEPELTAKLARRGQRIFEMPISYQCRGYDEGKKIGMKDGLRALYCIVRYGLAD